MVIYSGKRMASGCVVSRMDDREARLLPVRLDLRILSAAGFDWGWGRAAYKKSAEKHDTDSKQADYRLADARSGSAQLALAILADVFDENEAIALFEEFSERVISRLPLERWSMTADDVRACARLRGLVKGQIQKAA